MRHAKMLLAFIRGTCEFRADVTMHFDDLDELEAYDWGREIAHRLTCRRFDTP